MSDQTSSYVLYVWELWQERWFIPFRYFLLTINYFRTNIAVRGFVVCVCAKKSHIEIWWMLKIYRPLQSIDDIFGPLCMFIFHVHLIRMPSIKFWPTILGKHTKNNVAVSTARVQTWNRALAHTSALRAPSQTHFFENPLLFLLVPFFVQ